MRDYFCGWYFKCQGAGQTLAVIPAMHGAQGRRSCSVQLITADGAWNTVFASEQFQRQKSGFSVRIGENQFGREGIELHLHSPGCSAEGSIRFGPFSPIRYDIMGPFRYVPFMQCRHSIVSMRHTVEGQLSVNGMDYRFQSADGYIEGDRGYSFPKEYAWTHCFFEDGSIMLSVADIPFGPIRFTGVIGVIYWQGREYRLATYLGARAVKIENGEIVIRQGNMELTARLIYKKAHPLRAPVGGDMCRTIHESASCRALYRFRQAGKKLFSFESSHASFEYEYPS